MSPATRLVLQARMSSERLPGKALLPVAGIPMCVLAAHRASRAGWDLVVATSRDRTDDLLASVISAAGFRVIRGPLDDVLHRFTLATADMSPEDLCVRLTADNIFPDSDLVGLLIEAKMSTTSEYLSTAALTNGTAPVGLSAEVFTIRSLREADRLAKEVHDREHVTPLIRERHGLTCWRSPLLIRGDLDGLFCSVDTLEDYTQVAGFMSLCPDPIGASWEELIRGFQRYVTNGTTQGPARSATRSRQH